jgi:hypothetical protein
MLKKPLNNLSVLNQELSAYLYAGYDLHFIHGWFGAYLSAPSDSEEDLLIPTYLILDETKIADEEKFTKLVDKLVKVYSELADAIFENNKLIRPLIDFAKPNGFDPLTFSPEQQRNLLVWLYGYLTGYLAIGGDITEYASDENLLEERFFPGLFTLCIAFFKLSQQVDLGFMSAEVAADFAELQADLKTMWESEDGEGDVDELINDAIEELDMADVIGALNDVFYVVRVSDEARFVAQQNSANPLLGKLTSRN